MGRIVYSVEDIMHMLVRRVYNQTATGRIRWRDVDDGIYEAKLGFWGPRLRMVNAVSTTQLYVLTRSKGSFTSYELSISSEEYELLKDLWMVAEETVERPDLFETRIMRRRIIQDLLRALDKLK